ncbi:MULTISPECIES: hypothetical protein [Alphaproteobacteria]|uniref:hypothetical protein n=1 Tax=Alphaproteobacteria TaxID=28211 RepID=UPI0011D27AB2|nr:MULTISPECIES: hypothetical protein [Alphaproteobacteria]MCO6390061.1 hypothetical protein [Aliihoeflea aestuarii]
MRAAFPRSAALISASSPAGLRPAGFPAGRAEKTERAEGKIKEDGTISGRFWKLLLSAHWLGGQFRHHGFEGPRAAISRKALALQGFEQHHRRRSAVFRHFRPEPRL